MNPTEEHVKTNGVPYVNLKTGLREYVTGPDTSLARKARKARARELTLARQKGVTA